MKKNKLLNNIGLKLLALALAVASWYAIRETISFEITIPDIPLELRLSEGWAIFKQSANTVTVTFRGSQEDIRLTDHKQIKAVVELPTNAIAGSGEIPVTPHDIQGARNVRAVHVEPGQVTISLDLEAEKRVPVKSRTAGKPLSGEVEELICEPAIVLLRGPAQQLKQTEWVYTEPVDVDGRLEGFVKRCRVLPPSNTWTPHIEPTEVQVKVVIVEKTETLEWKDLPVNAVTKPNTPVSVTLTPARATVVLTGSADTLETLKKTTPKVFVDCIDLDPSLTYDLPVTIHVPPGQAVTATADPAFVHVTFGKP